MVVALTSIEHIGLAEEAYGRLRDAIFAGEFEPTEKLDIPKLADSFGISRQPIKDALARLSTEGLVIIVPRRGTYVRPVNVEDAVNILNARLMMETWAVGHAKTVSQEQLDILERLAEQMRQVIRASEFDFSAYNESDMLFHEHLVMLADNPEILRSYRALHSHYVTARYYYKRLDKSIASDDDHRRILACLKVHELQEACRIIEQHIEAGIHGIAQRVQNPKAAGAATREEYRK